MHFTDLAVPIASAMIFSLAAMCLKKGLEGIKGFRALLLICNLALALMFSPFLFLKAAFPGFHYMWQPAAAGLLFFLGQVASFQSYRGDLSVSIPVQGTKILMVAFLASRFLGQEIGFQTWIAAALSVAAIFLLRDKASGEKKDGGTTRTLVYSISAAFAFAAFDVSVQKWSPNWGALGFGAWAFLAQGILTLLCSGTDWRRQFAFARGTWKWLAAGALGLAIVNLGLIFVIGSSGNATLVNLLFNSRCLWSILFIWMLGRWFGNHEADSGKRVMTHRLGGAALMMTALLIAMLE
jgi:drug/metabolite transporter (DMT)-like permease